MVSAYVVSTHLSPESIQLRYLPLVLLGLFLTACGTAASGSTPPAIQRHFKHAPPMTISVSHQFSATLLTSDGTIKVRLLPKVAPLTVNNFVFLARHRYFDGLIFHRIVKGFMIQTGDPTGTGFGGPGYKFKDEKVTMKYVPGTVAMANSGANTNGSQFFIVSGVAGEQLPPHYTIFGQVTAGMATVNKLQDTPVEPNPGNGELSTPTHDVYLKKVTITEKP